MKIEENNMGNMGAKQAGQFFNLVATELGLVNFGFGITPVSPSICLGDKILLCDKDLDYPWFTKQMILHEIAHHLMPEDNSHGTRFHKKYAELVNRFLAGESERATLKDWLVERRRRLQEKKEHQLQIKPKDIQSARVAGIKARALQEVINYIGAMK